MEAAALHGCPTARAGVPRAPSTVRALPEGSRGAPPSLHTHREPWLQKPSLPERYTSLLPAEKTPPRVQHGAHGSQELPQQHRGRRLSQAGWGARHPVGTYAAPGAAARGSPGGCWPGPRAVSCLHLALMAHLSQLTLAHVGPALGRPIVRRPPSAGQAPGDCAAPREGLGRMAPTLAGRWRTVLCWQSRAVLVWGHLSAWQQSPPLLPPASVSRSQQFSWLGSPQSLGSLERSTHLQSEVWTGIFQALLFRCSSFCPAITCTSLCSISSTSRKLGRRFEGEDVVVAPWKGFSAQSRTVNPSKVFPSFLRELLMSSSFP